MTLPHKAMILAAGSGTRLRPLTDRVPKAMVPVAGKPVLQHAVESLRDRGVREIAINLCHLPEVVMNHFGDGAAWGVKIHYAGLLTLDQRRHLRSGAQGAGCDPSGEVL